MIKKIFEKFFPKPKKEETESEILTIQDFIAPSSVLVTSTFLNFDGLISKTYFIQNYPRYLIPGWLIPLINSDFLFDFSIHIHPEESSKYLKLMVRKLTEVQAEILERAEKLMIRDPELETAARDIEILRDKLITGQERMFRVGAYLTVYAENEQELKDIETHLRSIFETKLVFLRPAVFQQKLGFDSTLPLAQDKLFLCQPLNTEVVASFFPFVSLELTDNKGILYGINKHNQTLIIFDRFSLPNANMVIFGTAGSGKSFFAKLEILRSLMMGIDCIVIDPENEYQRLAETVGGTFINLSLTSPHHLNPFDLPIPREDERPEEVINSNVIHILGLIKTMIPDMTPEEESICERAILETYSLKDITPQSDPKTWSEKVPLFEDFLDVLEGMEGAERLVKILKKFTEGLFANFFNQYTNVALDKSLIVFGIRDMEQQLKPLAMYICTKYVWDKIRESLKKRILVVDEAWLMLSSKDSAAFFYGIVKRARKYYLGVTAITQDVKDFLDSPFGHPMITNSALIVLFKQLPVGAEFAKNAFNLTDEEKLLILEGEVGEGIFFAGGNHALIKVVASPFEEQIITTSPEEILKLKAAKKL